MKKNSKRQGIILGLILLAGLAGCGQAAGKETSGKEPQAENVYHVETVDLQITPALTPAVSTWAVKNGTLYFMDWENHIYREELSPEGGGKPEVLPILQKETEQLRYFFVGRQEEIGCMVQNAAGEYWVKRFSSEGEELSSVMLQSTGVDSEGFGIWKAAEDAEGFLYVQTAYSVFLFRADGRFIGEITAPEEKLIDMGISGEGKVYITYAAQLNRVMLARIDAENGRLDAAKDIPGNGRLYLAGSGGFYLLDNHYLYEYDTKEGAYRVLLDWIEHYVNAAMIQSIVSFAPEELGVISWNYADSNQPIDFLFLTETTREEKMAVTGEKQEVKLFTMSVGKLNELVVNFNKENENYQVVLEEIDYGDIGDMELFINTRLMGKESPDLIDFDYSFFTTYRDAGVLADLTPYMTESEAYKKEAFLESAIEPFVRGEAVYALPKEFSVATFIGRTSQVESLKEHAGMSIEGFVEWLEQNPDVKFYRDGSRTALLQYCLRMGTYDLVDYESGTCNLDGREFKELLQRLEKLNFESGFSAGEWEEIAQSREKILDVEYLRSFYDLEKLQLQFGTEMSLLGFPREDGALCTELNPMSILGILNRSEHKEGAWEFVEYFMEHYPMYSGFPTRKEDFEREKAAAGKKQYEKDEKGKKYEVAHDYKLVGGNVVEIFAVDKRQIEQIEEAIACAKTAPPERFELGDIIMEEYCCYLNGDKSLEECLDIMQNRAGLYLAESR
ncbi:MAG: extracellular solute-binding protein [Roseburia sp.]|nr:extracellular solute-binding protein [Roseburia sp.]